MPTLLDVGPDELLGVLLQHLVDLVQDRVHVVGQLLLALLDLLARLRAALLGVLATPGSLPLAAGVLCRHAVKPPSSSGLLPASTVSSPADSMPNPGIGLQYRDGSCRARPLAQPWPVSAATSSEAVRDRSIRSPTCARVPRNGSSVGTRCSESWPGMSKITESHEAAATESGYFCRQRPRK